MRQNPDCAKSILLYVQDKVTPSMPYFSLDDIVNDLPQYSKDEFTYHLHLLNEQNCFTVFAMDDLDCVGRFGDLTSDGQTIATAARDDTLWNKALKVGKGVLPRILEFLFLEGGQLPGIS